MKHYWWDEWRPEPPYKGSESIIPAGSEAELQAIIDNVTGILPDILSSDKKKVITSKLEEYKNSLEAAKILKDENQQALYKLEKLEIWENNQETISKLIIGTKTATEERLKTEKDEIKKKELEKSIEDLEKILIDISGLNLAKKRLKEVIQSRMDTFGYDDMENDYLEDDEDWEEVLKAATSGDFNNINKRLLKELAKLIVDFWLTDSDEDPKVRLKMINDYLKVATAFEKEAFNETERKNAISKLRNSLKSQKGSIRMTIEGKAEIVDGSTDHQITLSFVKESLGTNFEDASAIGKLHGITNTNKVIIFYNFEDGKEEQNKRFEKLKNQLTGWEKRKLIFYFDKLEVKTRKLVRIEGTEIHLDYDSYTRIEVSEGIKLPEGEKKWENIHTDFANPILVKNWTDLSFTYEKTKEWIDIGIKPDEQKLVSWLIAVKGGNYKSPEWVLNNAINSHELRKEWLGYEINKRLNKYKNLGWNAEEKYNEYGKNQGHWGSTARGNTWKDYLSKIKSVKPSSEDEFSYFSVRGGLLAALAELLIPEFLTRWRSKTSDRRNMKKVEILEYINQNCTTDENNYYNNLDGKIKGTDWKGKKVRAIVENLTD